MTATPCSRTPSSRSSEKLTLLRINRAFMEFMREHYNHLSRQDFKMTVVREKDNSDGDTEEEAAAK